MRGDPVVTIICDGCEDEEFANLTPLAGSCFDMRSVDSQLRRAGWTTEGDRDYCAICTEDRKDRSYTSDDGNSLLTEAV